MQDKRTINRYNVISISAGIIAVTQGVLLFAGIEYNIPVFVSIIEGATGMNPLTAVCFIFTGTGLIILAETIYSGKERKFTNFIFYFLLSAVLLTGLLRFIEYLSGVSLSLAHLVSREWAAKDVMAPNTAFNFIILSSSALLIKKEKIFNVSLIQPFVLLAGFISFLTIIGYIYSLFSFNIFNLYLPPMALNTAIVFILLSAGILFLKPERGLTSYITSSTTTGKMARRMLLGAVMGPVILGWLRLYLQDKGYFDSATGTTLYTWVIICILFVIILFSARRIIIENEARRLAEKRIADSELMLRAIIDNSPAAIYVKDLNGRFMLVNKKTEENHRLNEDKIVGKDLYELFPDAPKEAIDVFVKNDKAVAESGRTMEYEESAEIHDGKHVYLSQKFPLRDINNNIYATSGISTDITDRKKAEERMKLLNAQLTESNKELESFSYSVSHDLRAPLRHIIGFGEKLNKAVNGKMDQEERRLLGKILSSAGKMAALIDDLLMFSRVGRTELDAKKVDMSRVFEEVIEECKNGEGTGNITWNVDVLPEVTGDQVQLTLVVSNLVSNAVKYTEKKAERIISAGSRRGIGETVFYVKDNGAGFDMKYSDKLFGVFQRLHKDDEYPGTGIGLATVKRIISRHGGRTWAEAEPDKGATFYFSLPD